jgi:fibronectin type 3 domain-containing protein
VLTYTDSTVQSGAQYYYVATAVDSSGNESVNSNEVSALIP